MTGERQLIRFRPPQSRAAAMCHIETNARLKIFWDFGQLKTKFSVMLSGNQGVLVVWGHVCVSVGLPVRGPQGGGLFTQNGNITGSGNIQKEI